MKNKLSEKPKKVAPPGNRKYGNPKKSSRKAKTLQGTRKGSWTTNERGYPSVEFLTGAEITGEDQNAKNKQLAQMATDRKRKATIAAKKYKPAKKKKGFFPEEELASSNSRLAESAAKKRKAAIKRAAKKASKKRPLKRKGLLD